MHGVYHLNIASVLLGVFVFFWSPAVKEGILCCSHKYFTSYAKPKRFHQLLFGKIISIDNTTLTNSKETLKDKTFPRSCYQGNRSDRRPTVNTFLFLLIKLDCCFICQRIFQEYISANETFIHQLNRIDNNQPRAILLMALV